MYIIGGVCVLSLLILWTAYLISRSKGILNLLIKHTLSLVLVCIAIILALFSFCKDRTQLDYCDNELHTIEGEVDEVVFSVDYFAGYIATINKVDGTKCSYKVMIIDDSASLDKNSLFIAKASFKELTNQEIGFDTAQYYISDGIIMGGEIQEYIHISEGRRDIFDFFQEINAFLDRILKDKLNEEAYPIASALILGNRNLLSDNVNSDFARLGIVHILSLSGLHVSIIVAMLASALSKSYMPKVLQIIIILTAVTFFVGLSGFCEPAIRAGLMQFLFYVMFIFWDTSDSITDLFVSVTLICIFSPYLIFSLSLMLSFLAMLGCICSSRVFYKTKRLCKIKSRLLKFCILTSITTIGVTFITLPLIYIFFGYISLLSIPANIVIIPILNIIIYLVPFILLFSPIGFVSDMLAFFCEIICSFVLSICEYLADFEGTVLHIQGSIQLAGVIIIFLSCVMLFILPRKKLKIAIASVFVGIIVFSVGIVLLHSERKNHIYFTSYSFAGNDVVCVEMDNDLTVIDISNHSLNSVFANDMSCHLGYDEVENYIALTYSHKSAAYMDKMIDTVIINHIFLTTPKNETEQEYFNECVLLLNSKNIDFTAFDNELLFDDINLDVCNDMFISRSTKRCIAFNLSIQEFNYTYMGASTHELVSGLPDKYAHNADVLVFGTYGPKYKSSFYYDASI